MRKFLSPVRRWLGLAAAGIGLVSAPLAAATAEENRNVALVQHGFDAWRDGTGSPYDLLADDVAWTISGNSLGAGTYPSKEAFMSGVIRPFNARMKERLVPVIHRIHADGDTVVIRFDAKGVARDNVVYANSYAWFLQMEEGRIVRAYAFFDSIAFDDLWRRVEP